MRIACFGGAHLDTKAHLLEPPRLGSSNPARVTRSPGGVACNVARSLTRLGAEVTLCSVTGGDDAGASLRATLRAEGIDPAGLAVVDAAPTAGYLAVLDPGGGVVIGIADMAVYDTVDEAWVKRSADRAAGADLWVVDANLPERVLDMLVAAAPVPVLADPVSSSKAGRLRPVLPRLEAVFPDGAEAAVLGGFDAADHTANAAAIAASGTSRVVVTLGAGGAHECGPGGVGTRPAVAPGRVVDVTGAGDALLAGYAYAFAAGEADPLGWGLAAASLAVATDASVPEGLSSIALRRRLGR